MKSILFTLMFVANFCVQSSAQEGGSILGTWYMIDMSGESRQRIVLSENQIVTERWITYNVEEPYWKEDKVTELAYFKSDKLIAQILTKDERLKGVSPGQLVLSPDFQTLDMYNMKQGFDDNKEALTALNDFEFKEIMSRPVYSKERLDQINSLPSTEKLSKKEFMKLMTSLESYNSQLTDFVKNSGFNNVQRMVYYVTDKLFKQGLIDLGYNPWKPTNEYFVERLRQDPEIASLLEKQLHFKL